MPSALFKIARAMLLPFSCLLGMVPFFVRGESNISDPLLASVSEVGLCEESDKHDCGLSLRQLRAVQQNSPLESSSSAVDNPQAVNLQGFTVKSTVSIPPFVGMGYNPQPEKIFDKDIPCDDFMAPWSEPLWGPSGRYDLQVMKNMGVDVVRTYGIGSQLDHRGFLDIADELGLKVNPGFADFPYTGQFSSCGMQNTWLPRDCIRRNDYNCHDTIKAHYSEMLKNGYTVVGADGKRRYHPALFMITLVNEIELKLMYGNGEGMGADAHHARVVASALDGLLSAEDSLKIVGPRPFVTATTSYALCQGCKSMWGQGFPGVKPNDPFLPFVADYFLAFRNPRKFIRYEAQHDLFAVYQSRWVNSFNTPRLATSLCEFEDQVLLKYALSPLGNIPVYIGEFHYVGSSPFPPYQQFSPHDLYLDVLKMRNLTNNTDVANCGSAVSPLVGFNIFEYQVSYWKGAGSESGTALGYGLWGLGGRSLGRTRVDNAIGQNQELDAWCVFPCGPGGWYPPRGQYTHVQGVVDALGGKMPTRQLC